MAKIWRALLFFVFVFITVASVHGVHEEGLGRKETMEVFDYKQKHYHLKEIPHHGYEANRNEESVTEGHVEERSTEPSDTGLTWNIFGHRQRHSPGSHAERDPLKRVDFKEQIASQHESEPVSLEADHDSKDSYESMKIFGYKQKHYFNAGHNGESLEEARVEERVTESSDTGVTWKIFGYLHRIRPQNHGKELNEDMRKGDHVEEPGKESTRDGKGCKGCKDGKKTMKVFGYKQKYYNVSEPLDHGDEADKKNNNGEGHNEVGYEKFNDCKFVFPKFIIDWQNLVAALLELL